MGTVFGDLKSGVRQKIVWVDYERYVWRVFAGSPLDWYRNPVRFAATLSQAHRIIPSDLVTIDVTAPYLDWYRENTGHYSGSPVDMVQSLLAETTPYEFVEEAVDALAHSLGNEVDLVLKLQSPHDLLCAVGASEEEAEDFGNLDDTGTALVSLIRKLSGKPFGCLQIASSGESIPSIDQQDAQEPLQRAAEYYGWATSICMENYCAAKLPEATADLMLLPELPLDYFAGGDSARYGGGLASAFWLDQDSSSPELLPVLYGRIPESATPELVAEKMKMLIGQR